MFSGSRYCHKCQKPISLVCRNRTHLSSTEVYCCECWTQYQTENNEQNVSDYSVFDYESSERVVSSSKDEFLQEDKDLAEAISLSLLEQDKYKASSSHTNIYSQNISEIEELTLALEISKIEHEEFTKENENTQPNQNATQSEQAHCPICYEDRLEYALIECGHVVCGDCKPKLKECPICRADIRGTVRIYISN